MKLFVLVAVVALLGVGDVTARSAAEDQIAKVTHESIPEAGPTSARVHSFPFLGRLLVLGEVPRIVVRQSEVRGGALVFASITVDLRGVKIDRDRLRKKREVELTDLDRGIVSAELTDAAVSAVTRVPVRFQPGRVTVTVRGRPVAVEVSLDRGALLLSAGAAATYRVPVPDVPLLPCVTAVRVEVGRILLTCELDEIPPELLRAANRRIPQPAAG